MPPKTDNIEALRLKYGIQGGRAAGTPAPAGGSLDAIQDPQERLAELRRQADAIAQQNAPKPPEKKSVGGFIKNIGKSGADLIGGVVNALIHPVKTAGALGNLALGAGQKLVGYEGDASAAVDQVVDFYKTRYGKDIKETLYNDPIGVLADLTTVLGGGGALLRTAGKAGKISELATASGAADKAIRYGSVAEKAAIASDPLRLAAKGASFLSKEVGATEALTKAKTFVSTLFKGADKTDEALRTGKATEVATGLREKINKSALDSGMDAQTQTILRRAKPGEKPAQTAKRLEKEYAKYSKAEELYQKDPSADNALQVVGTEIGEGYKAIIKKQQELGKMIGTARKEATTPVAIKPAQDFIAKELTENGIVVTPRGYKIQKGYSTKLTSREINELLKARKELASLSKNPTAENLSNFKQRIAKDIDFSKPMGKSLPDAERIMRGTYDALAEALNVKGSPDLQGIYAMNKEYERLSKLLDEGEGILGKKTLTGDFKHDAGLAKASIKSLHSGAKKDFLQALGKETGEDYIQKSLTAAQAMKDLGSFQQASLLEELASGIAGKNDQLRLNIGAGGLRPSAIFRAGIDKIAEKGRDVITGTPKERTVRYIQEGAGKVKDRIRNAKTKVTEVPKVETGRLRTVINEALRQAGYTTKPGGSAIRVRNAQILKALGVEEE